MVSFEAAVMVIPSGASSHELPLLSSMVICEPASAIETRCPPGVSRVRVTAPSESSSVIRMPERETMDRTLLSASIDSGGSSFPFQRSEEHTSELQSHHDIVCRLLLEKKK